MSKKSNQTNAAASADETPGDNEARLSDVMFVEYVEMNLEEVKAGTARMQKELEGLKELKKKLLEEQNRCLQVAGLPVFEDGQNLMPRLKEVDAKTERMLSQLTKLIEAKVNLDEAYSKHCQHAKVVTQAHLKKNYDQYTDKSEEEVKAIAAQMEKHMEETLAKANSIRAELNQKKKEYNETHEAIMKDIAALNQVEQDAMEQLEQLKLEKALNNDGPSD